MRRTSLDREWNDGDELLRIFEDDTVSGLSTDFVYVGDRLVASETYCAQPGADTDADGIPNCVEALAGLNPSNAADAAQDPDADGLTNLQEYQAGTSYFSADTDADGMPDLWEVTVGLSATTANGSLDSDSDGLTNLAEYGANTNPLDADTDGDGLLDGVDPNPTFNPAVMSVIINLILD